MMGTDAYHGLSRPVGEVPRSSPPPHDRWAADRLRGTLSLRLTTEEGRWVSPGTGLLRPHAVEGGEILAQEAARRGGVPVVPGSGIKGAVRSLYELLSPSCDLLRSEGRKRRHEPCRAKPSSVHCCEACSLFGCLGYQGRVSFDDALPIDPGSVTVSVVDVPIPHQPHWDKTGGDLRLYDIGDAMYKGEVRPKELAREVYRGTFEGRMVFVNLSEEELGRLLLCLGFDPGGETAFPLRLGGVKYDGQGGVRVEPIEVTLAAGALGREVLAGEACRARCEAMVSVAKRSPWKDAFGPTLTDVAKILRGEEQR